MYKDYYLNLECSKKGKVQIKSYIDLDEEKEEDFNSEEAFKRFKECGVYRDITKILGEIKTYSLEWK